MFLLLGSPPMYLDCSQCCSLRCPEGWWCRSTASYPIFSPRPGLHACAPLPDSCMGVSERESALLRAHEMATYCVVLKENKDCKSLRAVCFIIDMSGGNMTMVNSFLSHTWTQSIFEPHSHIDGVQGAKTGSLRFRLGHRLEVSSTEKRTALRFYISASLANVLVKGLERNIWVFHVNAAL